MGNFIDCNTLKKQHLTDEYKNRNETCARYFLNNDATKMNTVNHFAFEKSKFECSRSRWWIVNLRMWCYARRIASYGLEIVKNDDEYFLGPCSDIFLLTVIALVVTIFLQISQQELLSIFIFGVLKVDDCRLARISNLESYWRTIWTTEITKTASTWPCGPETS